MIKEILLSYSVQTINSFYIGLAILGFVLLVIGFANYGGSKARISFILGSIMIILALVRQDFSDDPNVRLNISGNGLKAITLKTENGQKKIFKKHIECKDTLRECFKILDKNNS